MSRIDRRWALGCAIALAAALGTACSSDADVGLPAGGGPTAGGSPSGVEQTVAGTPSVSDAGGGTAAADVTATSFSFEPSEISIDQGENLRVKNEDATADHTFTIEGEAIDEIIPAGDDASVRADLPAGTYTVICRFHVDQGMEATLEIG